MYFVARFKSGKARFFYNTFQYGFSIQIKFKAKFYVSFTPILQQSKLSLHLQLNVNDRLGIFYSFNVNVPSLNNRKSTKVKFCFSIFYCIIKLGRTSLHLKNKKLIILIYTIKRIESLLMAGVINQFACLLFFCLVIETAALWNKQTYGRT